VQKTPATFKRKEERGGQMKKETEMVVRQTPENQQGENGSKGQQGA